MYKEFVDYFYECQLKQPKGLSKYCKRNTLFIQDFERYLVDIAPFNIGDIVKDKITEYAVLGYDIMHRLVLIELEDINKRLDIDRVIFTYKYDDFLLLYNDNKVKLNLLKNKILNKDLVKLALNDKSEQLVSCSKGMKQKVIYNKPYTLFLRFIYSDICIIIDMFVTYILLFVIADLEKWNKIKYFGWIWIIFCLIQGILRVYNWFRTPLV